MICSSCELPVRRTPSASHLWRTMATPPATPRQQYSRYQVSWPSYLATSGTG